MTVSKHVLGSNLAKMDAHVITPEEYEEIPELTDEWFEAADLYMDGKLVRHGPPIADLRRMLRTPKQNRIWLF